jgi:hypothetical protein
MGKMHLGCTLAIKAFDLHYISDRYEYCSGSDPQAKKQAAGGKILI